MDPIAQVRLAESFPGLVGNYYSLPKGDEENPTDEAEIADTKYERYELFCDARKGWDNAYKHYSDSELHKALLTLQDTMNTSIETDVRVGKVSITDDALTSVAGEPVTIPMTIETAELLYKRLDPSLVGVENRGDVLDISLRRSHEALAEALSVSDQIAFFNFPEELKEIQRQLCPSAVTIHAKLYKLVIYGEGDFFVPHRDSMSSPEMFGSLSLQIPIVCHHNDSEDHTKDTTDEGEEKGSILKRFREKNNDETKRCGQLVFYVGRHTSDAKTKTPSTCSFDDYGAEKRFAYVMDMEELGTAPIKEGDTIAVPYGAWTGDVLHEVRRVQSGYRAVLIYRLYKEGHRNTYIPHDLRETASNQLAHLMALLAQTTGSTNSEGKSFFPEPLRYVGVILRHAYPPAGLSWQYLKGIDAVLYSIASETNKCLLFNAYTAYEGDYSLRHSVNRDSIVQTVFLTASEHKEEDYKDDYFYMNMAIKHKVFVGAVWMQLGFGTLTGGGYCYGNADCGTDWWYRSAVMIITPNIPLSPPCPSMD